MKTKINIRKMLQGGKKDSKSNGSFDKGLIGLGIKFNTQTERK